MPLSHQDDCKVFSNPFMASLSNHRQLEQASFDKLRMSRHQWAASLCNRPAFRTDTFSLTNANTRSEPVADELLHADVQQDDCKVFSNPFMASLSNHRQLEQASFDKLRMSRHQWAALLCNRPGRAGLGLAVVGVVVYNSLLWTL